ncbi:MAG: hypothetical protein MR265_04555 [Erysipelotrichaceae bacterium]|nr:hypothetical protein [Erysipelotrichaceae bacterium]
MKCKVLLILLILVSLTGCGKVKKIPQEKLDKPEYVLKSSEDRLVFSHDSNKYEVVYYENDKIVKVESAIKFKTKEEAKQKYLEEKINTFNQTDYINNIYVAIEREDYYEDYKNLSKEELKKYFEKAGLEIEE